jgi:hypothetical protein
MYKLIKDPVTEKLVCINNLITTASFGAHEDNIDYQAFKKDLADGAELQDAEGNVIDGIAYLATLES